MKSRELRHVVDDIFENAEGAKVRGALVTKEPILLARYASELCWKGNTRSAAFKDLLSRNWDKHYSGLGADSYMISQDISVCDDVFFCAVNFYKTQPIDIDENG